MALIFDSLNGILTNGMMSPAGCNLIISQFNLGKQCGTQPSPLITDTVYAGGGGSYPMAPGEIKDFYKVVTPREGMVVQNNFVLFKPKETTYSFKVDMGDDNVYNDSVSVLSLDTTEPKIVGISNNSHKVSVSNLNKATNKFRITGINKKGNKDE